MKIIGCAFLSFLLWQSFAFSQVVTLKILDENAPIESVHVIVNQQVISVSDISGVVSLVGIEKTDSIRLSHLLYDDLILRVPVKDSIVHMTSRVFSLDSVTVGPGNQWEVFKSKIKPGMKVGRSLKTIPIYSIDTLQKDSRRVLIESKGAAVFVSPTKEPTVNISSVRDLNGHTILSKQLKEWKRSLSKSIGTKLGNCLYYSESLCRKNLPDGWVLNYLGIKEDCDVFRFYQIPQSLNGNAKIRGLVYLDCASGVLTRIEAVLSPIDIRVSNQYNLDVSFEYFPSTNTILPKEYSCDSYLLDDQGSLAQERKTSTLVEW